MIALLVDIWEEQNLAWSRGDETVFTEIPRKEQMVSNGVLEHDAQETAAFFGRCRVEDAVFINYALSSPLALELQSPHCLKIARTGLFHDIDGTGEIIHGLRD